MNEKTFRLSAAFAAVLVFAGCQDIFRSVLGFDFKRVHTADLSVPESCDLDMRKPENFVPCGGELIEKAIVYGGTALHNLVHALTNGLVSEKSVDKARHARKEMESTCAPARLQYLLELYNSGDPERQRDVADLAPAPVAWCFMVANRVMADYAGKGLIGGEVVEQGERLEEAARRALYGALSENPDFPLPEDVDLGPK